MNARPKPPSDLGKRWAVVRHGKAYSLLGEQSGIWRGTILQSRRKLCLVPSANQGGKVFTDHVVRSQRVWARVAGSMFWVVLVVDMTGMRAHSAVLSRSLLLLGSLCTVPLAFGLYYALKPVQVVLASTALGLRLLEAALGVEATVSRFVGSDTHLAGRGVRSAMWELAQWGDATNFAAFVFTIGSTVFFYLFVRSVYIPKVLAWWGLFASVVAMTACFTHLLRPAFPSMTIYAWIPMLLAETSTGLWLLFKSVRVERQVDGMRDSYAG